MDFIVLAVVTALFKGLKDEHYKLFLSKNSCKTMANLSLWVEKYINTKDMICLCNSNLVKLTIKIQVKANFIFYSYLKS